MAIEQVERPTLATPRQIVLERIAWLVKQTLDAVAATKSKGYPIRRLRKVYEALNVPAGLAQHVENKLVRDGVCLVSNNRIFLVGNGNTWRRLAAMTT